MRNQYLVAVIDFAARCEAVQATLPSDWLQKAAWKFVRESAADLPWCDAACIGSIPFATSYASSVLRHVVRLPSAPTMCSMRHALRLQHIRWPRDYVSR